MTDFSKKTGDYPSLSSVDLSILGLTHFLEKEIVGSVDHLNTEPRSNRPLINPQRGPVTLVGGIEVPVVAGPADDSAQRNNNTPNGMLRKDARSY